MYRTESFTHDGHELVYDDYGTGDRVVVYLHGLLLDADLNRGIAGALAERGHRVVLLDLLGHGRSATPRHASAYRIDSYAVQVMALLDHLGVDRAVLGGISLGANVSLYAAVQHPERVRGMVLEMPVMEWAVPAAALAFVPMLLAARYGAPVARVTSAIIRRIPDTPIDPLNSVLHSGGLPPEVMAAVLHGVLVGPVAPTQEQRATLDVPTLVLAHNNDLIHPMNDAANLARELPRAQLVRARSPLELRLMPRRLTEEISEFLDSLESTPGTHPAARPAGATRNTPRRPTRAGVVADLSSRRRPKR